MRMQQSHLPMSCRRRGGEPNNTAAAGTETTSVSIHCSATNPVPTECSSMRELSYAIGLSRGGGKLAQALQELKKAWLGVRS